MGDFRLVRAIGQGGMGQVWEAEQLSLGRSVAVKFVRPERVTPKQLELFEREARAGGRLSHPGLVAIHLSHPGLVAIHAYGETDGLAWIAMELVDHAWSLRDFLRDMKSAANLPTGYDREVARLVARIARAMQAAHEVGVIHRDLKPQNVLVTKDGRVKVTDFGLARIADETGLSQSGDVLGTFPYMSPEQASGRHSQLAESSDVFSLGIVLYELSTLQRPFRGDTPAQIAEQVTSQEPADPRTYRSQLAADLAVITLRALEKRPDDRYRSMVALADDLEHFLRGESIVARSPGPLGRIVRWIRRRPLFAAGLALLVLTLAVGAFVIDRFRRIELEATRADLLRSEEFALQGMLESERSLRRLHPDSVAPIDSWLGEAERMMARKADHECAWRPLRERSSPSEDRRRIERIQSVRASFGELERRIETVRARRARIERLIERTLTSPSARTAWSEAATSIRADPFYAGLELEPQFGLLPIGRNETSDRWEFLHLPSGRDDSAGWLPGDAVSFVEHGCVLILVSGGETWIGATRDPQSPYYDPKASGFTGPVHAVTLEPFFLGKYEFTQGQWSAVTGQRPSFFLAPEPTDRLPVEQVSWHDASSTLEPVGLRLPEEAEWETAARAGTTTPFPLEPGVPLSQYANVKDVDNVTNGRRQPDEDLDARDFLFEEGRPVDSFRDGFPGLAPVGSLRPNPWGFHDLSGNVAEWCADRWGSYPGRTHNTFSGRNLDRLRVQRGGGFHRSSLKATVSARDGEVATFAYRALGFRAARSLE